MSDDGPVRLRREPPRFRRVAVDRVERLGPRMVRVTLTGPELKGFVVEQPAASVRVLFPPPAGGDGLVLPAWNGNEFLLADGSRAPIRTFTPRRVEAAALELDIDVVLHGGGVASPWAAAVAAGDEVAVSGPGRGYVVDTDASELVLVGDETAIPAMSQLLEAVPPAMPVRVHVEVAAPDGRISLPHHPRATVEWHDLPPEAPPGETLVAAVVGSALADGGRLWVAGEAAGVQRIRRHLFETLGMARGRATVRGYWKFGRGGDEEDL